MEKSFRQEIAVPISIGPIRHEFYTVGLDVDDGHAEIFISNGGVVTNDAPIQAVKMAVAQWSEWLATL